MRGKIQLSKETATLLEQMGKGHWISPREDSVEAKGKGTMSTYWLHPRSLQQGSVATSTDTGASSSVGGLDDGNLADRQRALQKHERLIDWMVELITEYLKKVVAKQTALRSRKESGRELVYESPPGRNCLDEVTEVISLPKFDPKTARDTIVSTSTSSSAELDSVVRDQLRDYVASIAATYHDNPFHNFGKLLVWGDENNNLHLRYVALHFVWLVSFGSLLPIARLTFVYI